jgi:prepilin-type N-terminal cleavage/methylation domain-containing protein
MMERQQRERQRIATGDWRLVERQRGERQRLVISEWRLVKRQQEASRKWRIVSRQSPVANCQSPVAAFRFAFTLTELLTVIAIIAILMGLLVAFYRPSQEQRKVFECQNHLQVIHRALRLYMLDWEGFPASPYDSLDNDNDGRFDEDPPDRRDNDGDGRVDEDPPDALVGGLLALLPKTAQGPQGLVSIGGYLRTHSMLLCPSDPNAAGGSTLSDYSSYQGCDTGTGFVPGSRPMQVQTCPQGIPTYAITRFPPNTYCHPSGRDDDGDRRVDEDDLDSIDNDQDGRIDEDPCNLSTTCTDPNKFCCTDPDKFRQLGIRNTSPCFINPTLPSDDTVVTWCVHHRYMPNTTTPNYVKGGVPADLVLYWDGQVRIQQMPISPDKAWRRKPNEP